MIPALVSNQPAPGLWSRLLSVPGAVGRSSSRITRASLFTVELLAELRARAPSAADSGLQACVRARKLSWFAENMCSLHGIKVDVVGTPLETPAVYVSNHLGWVDPLAILSVVPCAPIAKEEIGSWPLVGPALLDLGVLMVRRNDPYSGARVLRAAMRTLERGVSVLAFPEGTTTEGDDVLRLRRGVFGLARLLDIPIVPIAVRHDAREVCWIGDDMFLPHYVKTASRPMIETRLVFGEPIDPASEDDPWCLARRTRRILRGLLLQGPRRATLRA
jgi:lyso-ornithine lipid O-acyltransferase